MSRTTEDILRDMREKTGAVNTETENASAEVGGKKGWNWKKFVSDNIIDLGEEQTDTPVGFNPLSQEQEPVYETVPTTGADIPFSDIYAQAYQNRTAAPECTVDELEELLTAPEIATQPSAMKKIAVTFALKASKKDISMPLADAEERKTALQNYLASLQSEADATREANELRVAQIQAELEDMFAKKQAEMDELRAQSEQAQTDAHKFEDRVMKETMRIDELIKPFKTEINTSGVETGRIPSNAPNEAAKPKGK
jgi:hypothetical protein